jgi:hypothetical protein
MDIKLIAKRLLVKTQAKMKLERRARYSRFKLERHDGCAKRSHGRAQLMLVTLYESIAVKIDYRIVAKLQTRVNSDFVLYSPRAASTG